MDYGTANVAFSSACVITMESAFSPLSLVQ